jgi:tyrosine-specific transport protein
LVDFLADGFRRKPVGFFRIKLTILIFMIPLIFSYCYPAIFEKALGLAGGYGEAFLNGLLPISVYYVGRYVMKLSNHQLNFRKFDLFILTLFSLIVITLETIHLFAKG